MLLVAFLRATAAEAAEPVAIDWKAPPECPTREQVRSDVLRLAGETETTESRARTTVLRESNGRWRVNIQFVGAVEGTRTLTAQSCDSAARAAALVIALAVNPEAASRISQQLLETEPAPPEVTPPPPAPVEPTPPKPPPRASVPPAPVVLLRADIPGPREARWVWPQLVMPGLAVEQALMPTTSYGVMGGVAFLFRRMRADLTLSYIPPREKELTALPGISSQFSLATASLRGCAAPWEGSLTLYGCLGLRGHFYRVTAVGLAPPSEASPPQFIPGLSATGGLLATWPSRTFMSLAFRGDLVVAMSPPSFVIRPLTESVFKPNVLGAALEFALVITPGIEPFAKGKTVRR